MTIRYSRRVFMAAVQVPAMITMTYKEYEGSEDGYSFADCAKALRDAGADVVGTNCMREPEEMLRIAGIMRQAVDSLPEGPIMGKVGKVIKPPVGEAYVSIEAPKGELGYYIVSDGSTQPYRVRVRPPSFVNLQALDRMIAGGLVADVAAVIGTLDIVLGEIDR